MRVVDLFISRYRPFLLSRDGTHARGFRLFVSAPPDPFAWITPRPVKDMRQIGHDLNAKYKETAQEGLAVVRSAPDHVTC